DQRRPSMLSHLPENRMSISLNDGASHSSSPAVSWTSLDSSSAKFNCQYPKLQTDGSAKQFDDEILDVSVTVRCQQLQGLKRNRGQQDETSHAQQAMRIGPGKKYSEH